MEAKAFKSAAKKTSPKNLARKVKTAVKKANKGEPVKGYTPAPGQHKVLKSIKGEIVAVPGNRREMRAQNGGKKNKARRDAAFMDKVAPLQNHA
jgi:hypothetical protein